MERLYQKPILIQEIICFCLILANFIAQIPYFFHLYAFTQAASINLRSGLIMGAVFFFFMASTFLFFRKHPTGYWMMAAFLCAEFLFYFVNQVGSVFHGNGLFVGINNPDLILKVIYSIGYINLFAAGYWLYLLVRYRGPAS